MLRKRNFDQAVIYKISCKDENVKDFYIGSTTNLCNRRYTHRHACTKESNKNYNFSVYQCIRENGGFANWNMDEIEQVSCKSLGELLQKEREYYDLLQPTLNKKLPMQTDDEKANYGKREDVILYRRNYHQQYYHTHPEYKKNQLEMKKKKYWHDKRS